MLKVFAVLLLCAVSAQATIPNVQLIPGTYASACAQQGALQWSVALQVTQSTVSATYTFYPYSCSAAPGLVLSYVGTYALGPLNAAEYGATKASVVVSSVLANSTGFASSGILSFLCPDAPPLSSRIGSTVDMTNVACTNFSVAPFDCTVKKFAVLLDMSTDYSQLLTGNGSCDSNDTQSPPAAVFLRTSSLPSTYAEYSTYNANYAHTNFVPQSSQHPSYCVFYTNVSICQLNSQAQLLVVSGFIVQACGGRVIAVNISNGATLTSELLSSMNTILLSASGDLVFGFDGEYLFCLRMRSNSLPTLWTAFAGYTPSLTAPVVNGDFVYTFGSSITTRVFNISTGQLLAQTARSISYLSAYAGQLYSVEGSYFCQISPVTLQRQWSVYTFGSSSIYPAIANNIALVVVLGYVNGTGNYASTIYAISLTSHQIIWNLPFSNYNNVPVVAIANGLVFSTMTNYYYSLSNGQYAGYSIVYTYSNIASSNDQLYAVSNRQLYVMSQSSSYQSNYFFQSVASFVIAEGLLVVVPTTGSIATAYLI